MGMCIQFQHLILAPDCHGWFVAVTGWTPVLSAKDFTLAIMHLVIASFAFDGAFRLSHVCLFHDAVILMICLMILQPFA